jgi:tetratricopeptide (TPR) repeat protein
MAVRRSSGSPALLTVLVVSLLWATPAVPAQAPPPPAPKATTEAAPPFGEVSVGAARARETGALDEAVRWYRRGVQMRPRWDEGWWYLATLLYELDRYAEARDAFEQFLLLKPEPGPGWALRGLCEFELKGYRASLEHLNMWMTAGQKGNDETRRVAWYHLSVLRIKGGQFGLALEPVTFLCRTGPDSPQVVTVAGLMLVRLPVFPWEVPEEKQELVDVSGRAIYSWLARHDDEARSRFKELFARFPETPNAHYCYGLFLKRDDPEGALAQFKEEMKIQPESVYPRLETAFALLRLGDYAGARPYAEDSVKLAPGLFAAHNALGQVLVDLGELSRGIAELEEAARLAPESYEMFYALAQAYSKAGRKEDAERARAAGQRLDALRRAKITDDARGGVETSSPIPP